MSGNNAPAGVPENQTPTIDIEKLKSDIASQNENLLNAAMAKIDEKIDAKEKEPEGFSYDDALDEFKDDLSNLRVDDTQAKALLNIFNKLMSKEQPKVKKEVLDEVSAKTKAERAKEAIETEVATLYPDALNKNSKLFKQAAAEYNALSDTVKRSPDGQAVAVLKAAAKLGIAPMDINQIRANQAVGPDGSSGKPRNSDKVTEKQIELASRFGVKADKFEEKLKAIKAKSR